MKYTRILEQEPDCDFVWKIYKYREAPVKPRRGDRVRKIKPSVQPRTMPKFFIPYK